VSSPIPVVATSSGAASEAPEGAIPLAFYGGGGGASNQIESLDGSVVAVAGEDEVFKASVTTASGEGIFRILDVGGVLSSLLTDENGNPLDSSWSPAGVVLHHDLDTRTPRPPATGTFVLQSVNGITSWVPTA